MIQDSAADLREEFAAIIGDRSPSPWRAAFAAVHRHIFVPEFSRQDEHGQWYRVTPADADYLRSVYSDAALTTQLDPNGIPTSSSSEPGLMLAMLDALDANPGDTVFELGTGSGYNAAILAHRLGAENVTSVDVDPELVALASQRLRESGAAPFVRAGDGSLGYPPHAPYSRFIATAALRCVPPTLIDQAAEAAVIVAPIGFGVIRVTVGAPGQADGRFLPRPALFIPRRVPGTGPDFDGARGQAPESTALPVTGVLDRWKFPLSLALPGFSSCSWRSDDGEVTGVGLWTEDGSTVSADTTGQVRQVGPRRLWDTVEAVADLFPTGEPAREDFGITITPSAQQVWYREPDGPTWTLPTQLR